MSEALWIELIKVLPAFLWIGFGFIALAVAKRIFTAQAPRMSKIETPWVTVELAQQAMEQAAMRGPASALPSVPPVADPPPWADYGAPPEPVAFDDHEPVAVPRQPVGATPPASAMDERSAPTSPAPQQDPGETETPEEPEPSPPSPPAWPGPVPYTRPRGYEAPTEPPRYPPPYYPGAQRSPYELDRRVPPLPDPRPDYGSQAAAIGAADAQRGLRAATRLAFSADLLQGGAILWVDDHHEWNEPLIRLFRTAGITVDAVVSTARAMLALKERHYDLVISDLRRLDESGGDAAGVILLDQMVAAGIPTPAAFFSDNPNAQVITHPRAVVVTNSPERLVDTVVDIVGTRRNRGAHSGAGWLERLRGH